MPPSPAYHWLCVLSSAADIVSHAARIRAAQIAASSALNNPQPRNDLRERRTPRDITERADVSGNASSMPRTDIISDRIENKRSRIPSGPTAPSVRTSIASSFPPTVELSEILEKKEHEQATDSKVTVHSDIDGEPFKEESVYITSEPGPTEIPTDATAIPVETSAHALQSSRVPSSRIGRFFHYGGLATSLGYGAAAELLRRRTGSSQSDETTPLMMTEANIKRLVSKLSQMRGAALKIGQFFSIQDTHVLPPELDKIFRRVQNSAHYMPDWQMERVMQNSLGRAWSKHFESFERVPFAAASIGQVHRAILTPESSPTGKPADVAVKIQFPNVANSIESDLGYVKLLLTAGSLLPKGLFLDRTTQVMKAELADECDYTREASYLRTFASPSFLGNDPRFKVPWVWDGSTERVLVMERVGGVTVGDAANGLSEYDRDEIASNIIELCLKELFEFRTMQTDPNWTNFLWNADTRQIELIDFGATREYSKGFIDNWFRLLQSAVDDDRDGCIQWSLKLGYLTGEENEIMVDAHVKSMLSLGVPFRASTPQPCAFGPGTEFARITGEIRTLIPLMLRHRLTPPPRETYSLNRKLSGALLLASRLGAKVNARDLWDKVTLNYKS